MGGAEAAKEGPDVSLDLDAIRARAGAGTTVPLVVRKKGHPFTGSVHYEIETRDPMPRLRGDGPPATRMVAWFAGGLGEHLGTRPPERFPEMYRDDPEVEADATFLANARQDVTALLGAVDELAHVLLATNEDGVCRCMARLDRPGEPAPPCPHSQVWATFRALGIDREQLRARLAARAGTDP